MNTVLPDKAKRWLKKHGADNIANYRPRNVPTRADTFWNFVEKMASGCWEWRGGTTKGYGTYRDKSAHRVSYERYKGPIPPGMIVCHSCDNPSCVNPDHLWAGTYSDNANDMWSKGRGNRNAGPLGELNPVSKLKAEQALEIMRLSGAVSDCELARRYGVSSSAVRSVRIGRTWAHLQNR